MLPIIYNKTTKTFCLFMKNFYKMSEKKLIESSGNLKKLKSLALLTNLKRLVERLAAANKEEKEMLEGKIEQLRNDAVTQKLLDAEDISLVDVIFAEESIYLYESYLSSWK